VTSKLYPAGHEPGSKVPEVVWQHTVPNLPSNSTGKYVSELVSLTTQWPAVATCVEEMKVPVQRVSSVPSADRNKVTRQVEGWMRDCGTRTGSPGQTVGLASEACGKLAERSKLASTGASAPRSPAQGFASDTFRKNSLDSIT
jgi:hypothetical protein